jgi:hypothetical protein
MKKGVFCKHVVSLLIVIYLIPLICIDSVESLCTGVGPNRNENLQNTCDWSTWYPWNCSQCNRDHRSQQFRKRAICCDKDVDLQLCLTRCNFSATSDTQYANCSNQCDSNNGTLITKPTGIY